MKRCRRDGQMTCDVKWRVGAPTRPMRAASLQRWRRATWQEGAGGHSRSRTARGNPLVPRPRVPRRAAPLRGTLARAPLVLEIGQNSKNNSGQYHARCGADDGIGVCREWHDSGRCGLLVGSFYVLARKWEFWREIIFTTHARPLKFLSRGTRADPAPKSGLVMTWHVFVFGAQMGVLAGNNFYDTCETSQISLQGYQGRLDSQVWPGDDVARFLFLARK